MTLFGTPSSLILGIIAVGAFALVADDLNEWFHRPVTTEHLKTSSAAQNVEAVSNGAARDQASVASGQGADDQSAKRISLAESRAQAPERSPDRSPAETGRHETAAKVDPEVAGRAADAAARTTDLAGQDQAAPASQADRQVAQSEPRADAAREVLAAAVQAPAEKSANSPVENVEQPADSAAAATSTKSNDVASADEAAAQGQQSEPSKEMTAQAPSQPRDQAPAEVPGRDTVSNADAQFGGANAAAAESSDTASEQTAAQRGQESEPPKEMTAQAPSQPLDQAPAEVPGRDAVVSAEAQAGGANAAAAESSDTASEQTAAQRGQESESPKEMTAQAPSQPLDQAPAEVPGRDAVVSAEAQAGGANAAAAESSDTASEQTAAQRGQESESPKEMTAQAPSQPLDQAPAEVPGRDAVVSAEAQAGGANAAATELSDTASEQTAAQRGQESEPAKEMTAQAPSQPLDQAPAEVPGRDAVVNAEAQVGGANADAAAKSNDTASEQTAAQRGQQSEPAKEMTAQAPSQPLDQAPAEVPGRDAVVNAEAQVGGANADAAAKSSDTASEQTAAQRGQQSEPAKEITAQAPSQPLDQAPAEVLGRDAVVNAEAQVGGANADAAVRSASVAAADQTSNLQSQQAQRQATPRGDAPSQPPGDAIVEAGGRAQTGTGRWVISETISPVDYSPLVAASILLQSGASRLKLSIYCRRGRTDLELTSDRSNTAVAGSMRDIVVTHSINQDAPIERRWDMRGPVAVFRGDTVAFLRSLPADGELAVRVSDGKSVLHEGRFELDGLNYVRERFALACRWPSPREDIAVAAAARSAGVAAAEQTSNLGSRRSEQAQRHAAAQPAGDELSQPRADAPVEAASRAKPAIGGDRWMITETTSPVDYSPVVTASNLLQSGASRLKLSIYCRRGRTDLELTSERPDTAATGSMRDVVVTHSINPDAPIERRWDVRGSVAVFRGDTVAFLRSLPENGELAVRVSDGKSILHEGHLLLDGLSHVRDRFASACKWPDAAAVPQLQAESGKRKSPTRGKTQ